MWVPAKSHSIIGDVVRRRFDDGKLHAFLDVRVTPGVDIYRSFRNVFDAKDRRFLGARRSRDFGRR
jgi:hypothetical protein